MAITVSEIRVAPDHTEQDVFSRAVAALGAPADAVRSMTVSKRSVDARHRGRISIVYSVLAELDSPEREAELVHTAENPNIRLHEEEQLHIEYGENPLRNRPVVVGFGPAGMFAALLLAEHGYAPIVLERGAPVERRVRDVQSFWNGGTLNPESNVQFGEGGAGTFSDGKLTTRIGDPRCTYILRQLVRFGAPSEILIQAKPHIGTDHLRNVVRNVRNEVLRLGGEIRFGAKLDGILQNSCELRGISCNGEQLDTDILVLAIGHSARDTIVMLAEQGIRLESKPFSIGVRIEHLQSTVDRALYGELAGHPALGRASYQYSARKGSEAVYTFCMCPGGTVVAAASEEGGVVTNGMSNFMRDAKNANSALVVAVDHRDFGTEILAGMHFQRRLESAAYCQCGGHYSAPAESVGSFLGTKKIPLETGRIAPSYPLGYREQRLEALFPDRIVAMLREGLRLFERKMPGFAAPDAVLTGVETRTSSPVRIPRGEGLECEDLSGLYPCGEGAGYAGGIMSAAADGIRVAQEIMKKYKPFL